jgi:class 3 adenylate cyclase
LSLARLAGTVEVADVLSRPDLLGQPDLLREVVGPLEAACREGIVFCPDGAFFLPRLVAVAARILGRDGVEGRFSEALEGAVAAGARLEAARCRLELARLARAAGRDFEAASLATDALEVVDAAGALPLLGPAEMIAGDVGLTDRIVLMTDLVGSTELLVRAGDMRWREVLAGHDRAIRTLLTETRGSEIAHTGDGMCAWFPSADAAVECAHRIGWALAEISQHHPDLPLVLRCGVASGRLLLGSGQATGTAVYLAARVCAQAGPSEVLVTAPILAALTSTPRVTPLGPVRLKGFPDEMPLFRVSLAAAGAVS